nr:hypothetical protein [Tanacetum cinerariifolium]
MIHNELSNSTRIDLSKAYSGGDVVDLTGHEDPTDEDKDTRKGDLTGVLVSLGGKIFSEENKSRELNISGSDNTGDRGKTAGEIASEAKRPLVNFFRRVKRSASWPRVQVCAGEGGGVVVGVVGYGGVEQKTRKMGVTGWRERWDVYRVFKRGGRQGLGCRFVLGKVVE